MKKIILVLTIFLTFAGLNNLTHANGLDLKNINTFASYGLFGNSSNVNHSSAKRFKTHTMGHVRRGKFTCMRKHGCWGMKAKKNADKNVPCKKRG